MKWMAIGPNFVFLHKTLLSKIEIFLPFTNFQKVVLNEVKAALSQFYPDGWIVICCCDISN